jgi:ornithine cyclodeaminase/alanine dehydrogenase-like protein (mu-crystallin family)
MSDALLLSRLDLERLLDPPSVIDVLEQAFRSESRGEWNTPRRIAARTRAGGLLAMPCAGGSPEALGAKLASLFPGNGDSGLPNVSGLYALFDPGNGALQAVMDGGYLTLIRTAGVSALAARILARPQASTLGILGAGPQAGFHVRLIAATHPIEEVVIWARRLERAEALVASLRAREDLRHIRSWTASGQVEPAAGCDIVVTATGATSPVLEGRWLAEGAHVSPIGAHTPDTREVDACAVTRAAVIVVETTDTLSEAGDLQMAEAEAGGVLKRVRTLGALVDSMPPRDPRAITLFKSCGVAFEDLAVAGLAWRRARERGGFARFSFAADV